MFIKTAINMFVAPFIVGATRAQAKKHGARDFFHQGVAVYCRETHAALIKESLDEVGRFYGKEWRRYRKNIKYIIVDEEVSSTLWFGTKTLLVKESDANRMGSAVHMAGWLVADFQRIQALKRRHALNKQPSQKILDEVNESGKRMRAEYLAQRH